MKIDFLSYPVFFGRGIWQEFETFLDQFMKSGKIFILTDNHTRNYCLPVFLKHLPALLKCSVFSILPGEQSKDLQNLEDIYKWLMGEKASRDALLINLGGGVVSDLGGFAAATYKRGISYINVPTSLIGMADAAVGGKTGINIDGVKNQAGVFCDPAAVFVNPAFLETLPGKHLRAGMAEVIKSAALSGKEFWEEVKSREPGEGRNLTELIYKTVDFKCSVVSNDPFDKSSRKMLNFGHTVGHALEGLNKPGSFAVLHGEAVAAGMLMEAFMSSQTVGFPGRELGDLSKVILSIFELRPIEMHDFENLIKLMGHDKKNTLDGTAFSLLENIGVPAIGIKVESDIIIKSFGYYNSLITK